MFRTIVVERFGTYLGKRGERLVIRSPAPRPSLEAPKDEDSDADRPAKASTNRRDEEEVPLFRVGEIVLPSRGVTLSTDLIAEVVQRGIPITFLTSKGQPYAMLTSPMLTATIATRRGQLRAMENERGTELARAFVTGKLRNQASLLVYFAKALKTEGTQQAEPASATRTAVLHAAAEVRSIRKKALAVDTAGVRPDFMRETLMGIEGIGARAYWGGVKALLEGRAVFEGRGHRGATDPANALLNYGYGILSSRIWAALLHASLDPFAGMLHADRSGKPSLVLDLMEELRAPAVDRAVLAHLRLGKPVRFEGNFLDEKTRRTIADAVLERLEAKVVVANERLQLGSIIQKQARAVASHVRGEETYRPFAMTW